MIQAGKKTLYRIVHTICPLDADRDGKWYLTPIAIAMIGVPLAIIELIEMGIEPFAERWREGE